MQDEESDMNESQITAILEELAGGFRTPNAPILHWPNDYGLDYEDVFFPSEDVHPSPAV